MSPLVIILYASERKAVMKISSALEPGQVVMLGCHMGTS